MGENKDIEINLMRREAVGDFLKRSAERLPDKTAMVFGDKRFTYSEFNSTVNRFAHALMDVGISKGDVVSVITENCYQQLVMIWACLKIGAWYSPLNYLLRGREITYQINNAGAKIFFVESDLLDRVKEVQNELPTVKHYGIINRQGIELPDGWLDIDEMLSEKYSSEEPEV